MKKVKLEHGAGGELMEEFIKNISSLIKLKSTKNGRGLDKLEDAGIATIGKIKIALTTDSYTVKPIFFPGGDIGKLAVCGTINDLAVMGAEPIALSVSYILEEGFDIKYLEKITASISKTSHLIGVPIITGDTKVMEHGKIDNIVINTSGIGVVKKLITNDGARVGDKIIVSGSVGEHGIVLLANRFNFHTSLKSDCACVLDLVREVLKIGGITAMKDPTRGGLAACLNELAKKSNVGFFIKEENIPCKDEVKSMGELLGIDPLQTACEGRVVMCVRPEKAEEVLRVVKKFNPSASIIGEVHKEPKGKVVMETTIGGKKFLESPIGELYPRIC